MSKEDESSLVTVRDSYPTLARVPPYQYRQNIRSGRANGTSGPTCWTLCGRGPRSMQDAGSVVSERQRSGTTRDRFHSPTTHEGRRPGGKRNHNQSHVHHPRRHSRRTFIIPDDPRVRMYIIPDDTRAGCASSQTTLTRTYIIPDDTRVTTQETSKGQEV